MPELPEVETIRRQLAPLVEGRKLARIEILDPRWSRPLAPHELEQALTGRRVERLGRRGKYLVWSFAGDVHLAQHLRMTGAVLSQPDPEQAHVRVRLELSGGPRRAERGQGAPGVDAGAGTDVGAGADAGVARGGRGRGRLAIVDPRRFGTGELLLGGEALAAFFAARLGLEPFDERFTAEHVRGLAKGRTAPIKAFLLDQRRIAGVGNIYADEALFRAGVHPRRPAGRLSLEQYARLRESVIAALSAGIDARGASIDDFRHVDGVRGSFQNQFLVHLRADEPCGVCGDTIVKMVVGGRGTYVCETCQPRPRALRPQTARPGARSRRLPGPR
jgi:formamidopyrimidine-DNA glycosylase